MIKKKEKPGWTNPKTSCLGFEQKINFLFFWVWNWGTKKIKIVEEISEKLSESNLIYP